MTASLSIRLSALALVAAFGATSVAAQDAAPAAPAAEAPAAEQPAGQPSAEQPAAQQPAEGQPAAGQPGEATEPGLGQPYVAEVSGDWQIECLRTQLSADPCRLVQMLLDEGNPAVRVEMVPLPAGAPAAAMAAFYTPLETLLSEQLALSIDGGTQSKHMFNYCTPQYCISQIPFAADAVAAFKRGNKAEAVIVPLRAPDQRVSLSMSLTGFTKGFDRLVELNAANFEAVKRAQAAQQQGGN